MSKRKNIFLNQSLKQLTVHYPWSDDTKQPVDPLRLPGSAQSIPNERSAHRSPQVSSWAHLNHKYLTYRCRRPVISIDIKFKVLRKIIQIRIYLQQSPVVRPASVSARIPSTIRILNTSKAAIISAIAHSQINLLDPVISRHI